jgi:hypothetical protein
MPRYLISVISLILFFAFTYSDFLKGNHVSPETPIHSHELFVVKQGSVSDGTFTLHETVSIVRAIGGKKVMNHNRSLRAFVSLNTSTVFSLYVESAIERKIFILKGAYIVSPETVGLRWDSPTVISFNSVDGVGAPTRYAIDVHKLTYMKEVQNEFPTTDMRQYEQFDSDL